MSFSLPSFAVIDLSGGLIVLAQDYTNKLTAIIDDMARQFGDSMEDDVFDDSIKLESSVVLPCGRGRTSVRRIIGKGKTILMSNK